MKARREKASEGSVSDVKKAVNADKEAGAGAISMTLSSVRPVPI
jgi:hypothetical protein